MVISARFADEKAIDFFEHKVGMIYLFSGERVLIVALLGRGQLNKPANVFVAAEGVKDVRAEGKVIEFGFDGNDERLAEMLERLVGEGVKILAFRERDANSEKVSLRITRGDVGKQSHNKNQRRRILDVTDESVLSW